MSSNLVRGAALVLLTATMLAIRVARKVTPGQRLLREGDSWLQWRHDAREEYVYGFSAGYAGGYESACRVMDELWNGPKGLNAENDPLKKCFERETSLSQSADYYADAVTKFYESYPGDRDIMIEEVLEQLAKGLTVEQVHAHPFWRHSPTSHQQ
jgi:hypothetical protein